MAPSPTVRPIVPSFTRSTTSTPAARQTLSTRRKPKTVLVVPDLPKTRNLKVMRRVIRAAYLGEDPGDLSSLVNPESVEEIRSRR